MGIFPPHAIEMFKHFKSKISVLESVCWNPVNIVSCNQATSVPKNKLLPNYNNNYNLTRVKMVWRICWWCGNAEVFRRNRTIEWMRKNDRFDIFLNWSLLLKNPWLSIHCYDWEKKWGCRWALPVSEIKGLFLFHIRRVFLKGIEHNLVHSGTISRRNNKNNHSEQ